MTKRGTAPLLEDTTQQTERPQGETSTALVPAAEAAGMVAMFERLATNPDVNVEKLERLIAMQERIMAHNAKAAFDAAFARMQAELPEVDEKGKIVVKGSLRSTYARLEDIHEAVKPVLAKYGFAVRHRTEWPQDHQGPIRIVGILSHEQGHSEESAFEAPLDRSEFRTDVQSMGSTISYGRRYTTLDLLNITTRGRDDDGQSSGRPQPPDGYDAWLESLRETALTGRKALDAAWEKAKTEYRLYIGRHEAQAWAGLKKAADDVDRSAKR